VFNWQSQFVDLQYNGEPSLQRANSGMWSGDFISTSKNLPCILEACILTTTKHFSVTEDLRMNRMVKEVMHPMKSYSKYSWQMAVWNQFNTCI